MAALAAAAVNLGYVPHAVVGGGAYVEMLLARSRELGPSVSVGFEVTASTNREVAPGAASLRWTVGRLALCPLHLGLPGRLSVLGCGRADFGTITAQGTGIAHARTETPFWAAGGAEAALAWIPTRPLLVELRSGVIVPITRYEFRFEPDTVVYPAPSAGWSTSLGLGVLFL
jgi:hypothetical protein